MPALGRADPLGIEDMVAAVISDHAHPLFDMIDRHPVQHEPPHRPAICFQEETRRIPMQPAPHIEKRACVIHDGGGGSVVAAVHIPRVQRADAREHHRGNQGNGEQA